MLKILNESESKKTTNVISRSFPPHEVFAESETMQTKVRKSIMKEKINSNFVYICFYQFYAENMF